MKMKHDSKLVRWAYFYNDFNIPNKTSLCAFFWRAFFWVPLAWISGIALVIFLIGAFGLFSWATYGALPLAIGIGAYVVYKEKEVQRAVQNTATRVGNSVFVQGVKTVKGKFCPIITIE